MTLNELLSVTTTPDIYVTTETTHNTYYSTNSGKSFTASIFNDGDELLTNELKKMTVKYFKPSSETAIHIIVD